MILGIDIDDCIVMNSLYFLTHIEKEDLPPKILKEIMENINGIVAGRVPENLLPYLRPIWLKYNNLYDVYPHVSEVLYRLRKLGIKIVIVTARGNKLVPDSEDSTIKYLADHNIPYDEIVFNSHDKAQICLAHGINVLVEDSIKHATAINAIGVKTLLFNSIVNKDVNVDITRVSNWLEIEKIIIKILDQNKGQILENRLN